MNFAESDSVLNQAGERIVRFLEFDCKMAGVVVDAEMFGEARIARMLAAEAIEKLNGLAAAFKETQRFGFEAEVQFAAGLFAEPRDVFDAAEQVAANCFQLVRRQRKTLERTGQRADAGVNVRRRELGEQIEQQIGVG